MPLPLTVSCYNKIQIGFTFLVPAHLGSPGKRAVKHVCVCVCEIPPEWLKLETSNFVCRLTMWSISLSLSNCSGNGHGQGHATHFYILDLENFATASHKCIGVVSKLAEGQHVDYAYDDRARHGWMHKFIILWYNVVHVVPTLLCSSWQDFGWHITLRGPSVVSELLIMFYFHGFLCSSNSSCNNGCYRITVW